MKGRHDIGLAGSIAWTPLPPVGGLVSLITLIQVPSWGRRGDPIEASDSVDQPVADVADGPD